MSDIALKIENVSKEYRLGAIGGTSLREEVNRFLEKRKMKKHPELYQNELKRGEKFLALDNISLEIKKGEAIGIIGHNGAGKSTLLKLLSRVTGPTSGTIKYNGRISSMLEVGTGFHGELTGRENIYMNGAILGMSKAEVDAKMEQIIEFSEVRQFIDTPVKRYSSGMYVKLAFSVAAHLDSEIMIMDEVLAVGDINFQQKCLNKMKAVAKEEGRTVLYVSHNMATIRHLCSRCIVLNKGHLLFDGDVESAINIYSSKNEMMKKVYDLSTFKRSTELTNECRMLHIDVPKGEIDLAEKLKFIIHMDSQIENKNITIRFVIYRTNSSVVGTAYSKLFALFQGENIIDFEFNTRGLMSGNYYVSIILCRCDNEMQQRIDCVDKAFLFRINESTIYHYVRWINDGWGSVKFEDITVKEQQSYNKL